MKIRILVIILSLNFFQSIAQHEDCESRFEILKQKHDSLQGRITSHYEIELKLLNDQNKTIETDLPKLNKEIEKLNNVQKQLIKELETCKETSKELEKSKLHYENEKLTKQRDTLQQKINILSNQIKNQNKALVNYSKLDSLNKINSAEKLNFYLNNNFDFLLNNCTIISITNDEKFTSQSALAKQKTTDLKVVIESLDLLKEKYNAQKIQTAIANLKVIHHESELLKKHISALNQYEFYQDELKTVINSIISIDAENELNQSEMERKRKQNQISYLLFNYYSEYTNLAKYPYLLGIFQEISTKKKKDVNAPLDYLLNKL